LGLVHGGNAPLSRRQSNVTPGSASEKENVGLVLLLTGPGAASIVGTGGGAAAIHGRLTLDAPGWSDAALEACGRLVASPARMIANT
jgi:hypothetical protein